MFRLGSGRWRCSKCDRWVSNDKEPHYVNDDGWCGWCAMRLRHWWIPPLITNPVSFVGYVGVAHTIGMAVILWMALT